MREISYSNEFDLILLLFSSFGYFEDDDNFLVLKIINEGLKKGGKLYFDLMNRDVIMKNFIPNFVREKNGNLMIDRNEFDTISGRIINKRILIKDGKRFDMPFFMRLYNPSELNILLKSAGFSKIEFYGDNFSEVFNTKSRRIRIIAYK